MVSDRSQPRPQAVFPGFGGGPHLQSQGKAPWGRGCDRSKSRGNDFWFEKRRKIEFHSKNLDFTIFIDLLIYLSQLLG